MTRANALLLAAASLLCGCAALQEEYSPDEATPAPREDANPALHYEPSLERGLESLELLGEGRELVARLKENPIKIQYAPLTGPWPRYLRADRTLLIPEKERRHRQTLPLLLARGLALSQMYDRIQVADDLAEFEVLAAMAQARVASQASMYDEDKIASTPSGQETIKEICVYAIEGPDRFAEMIRRDCLLPNLEYDRPTETFESSLHWVQRMQQGLSDNSFYQLLYKRDLDRVRRNAITRAEADENASKFRGQDADAIWREERKYMYRTRKNIDDAQIFYRQQMDYDALWRSQYADAIATRIKELKGCQSYELLPGI
ncbi:MAG: hypothetical protein WC421_08255 [Elusimicrobiales bacterium]